MNEVEIVFLLLYVLPIFLCYLLHYLDENTRTIKDLFYKSSIVFVPFVNIFSVFALLNSLLERNNKLKKTKSFFKRIGEIKIKKK